MEEKSENTENDSLFGLLSSGTPKEHTPDVLALEAPPQSKNNIKLSVEERVNELELELHKEKEKAMKYEILLKERENARLETEHMFQTMKEQLKGEKLAQSVEIELSNARTRVEALEKRLDEMNQLFLKALKEQKPPAENAATSIMYQNLMSRLEDMVLAAQNRIENLEEETIQTKGKALKSEIMLRKMESFYPQVEEALAKVQDDNLKNIAGARNETYNLVNDIKEELKGIINNNEVGAKQRVEVTAENFRMELTAMRQRFEETACQLANVCRKAEDMENALVKVQDDNLKEIAGIKHETDNIVDGIKEELVKNMDALRQEQYQEIEKAKRDINENGTTIQSKVENKIQNIKEELVRDKDAFRQEFEQLKEEIKNNEVVSKQYVEETAENFKMELTSMRQRFEETSCQIANVCRKAEDMENALAKVQDDNLKGIADVRVQTESMVNNVKDGLTKNTDMLWPEVEKIVQGVKEEFTNEANALQQVIAQLKCKNEEELAQSMEQINSLQTEFNAERGKTNETMFDMEKQISELRTQLPEALSDTLTNIAAWLKNVFNIMKDELKEYIYILDSRGSVSQKIFTRKNELIDLMTKINIEIGRLHNEFRWP